MITLLSILSDIFFNVDSHTIIHPIDLPFVITNLSIVLAKEKKINYKVHLTYFFPNTMNTLIIVTKIKS